MKLFLQKKCKIFERWGLRPQTPLPPAAGGFASKPPSLWRLGASPPLRISGYAPVMYAISQLYVIYVAVMLLFPLQMFMYYCL